LLIESLYPLLAVPHHDRDDNDQSHKKDNPCPVPGWHSHVIVVRANYYGRRGVSNYQALQRAARGAAKTLQAFLAAPAKNVTAAVWPL
jgi:hypothetical protein